MPNIRIFLGSLKDELSQFDSRTLSLNEELLAVNDQVKRLKTLLAKSRDLLQEREEEITQVMKEVMLPWKSCMIEYCVEGGGGPKWYLLSTDLAQFEESLFTPHILQFPETNKCYRWVEEKSLSSWLEKQLTFITPSPEYLTRAACVNFTPPSSEMCTWYSLESLSQSREEKSSERIECLLTENRRLSSEVESLTQQFHTYKLRAQSALKRIGKDEQIERYKQMEEEENLWGELKGKIQDLEQDVETKATEVLRLLSHNEELRQELKEKTNNLLELEEKLRLNEMRYNDGQLELKRMEDKNSSLEEMVHQLKREHSDFSERLAEDSHSKNPNPPSLPNRVEEEKSSPVMEIRDEESGEDLSARPRKSLPLFSPSVETSDGDHQVYLAHIQVALFLHL